jgi:hypothetical protein
MDYSQQLRAATTHILLSYYGQMPGKHVPLKTQNQMLRKLIKPYLTNADYRAVRNELKNIDVLAKRGKTALIALEELSRTPQHTASNDVEVFGYLIKELEAVLCISITPVTSFDNRSITGTKAYLLESDIHEAFSDDNHQIKAVNIHLLLNKTSREELASVIGSYSLNNTSYHYEIVSEENVGHDVVSVMKNT